MINGASTHVKIGYHVHCSFLSSSDGHAYSLSPTNFEIYMRPNSFLIIYSDVVVKIRHVGHDRLEPRPGEHSMKQEFDDHTPFTQSFTIST